MRGSNIFSFPNPVTSHFSGNIVLEAPLTVERTPGGHASFTGDVDLGPHLLTVQAFQNVYFHGRVFRSGTTGTARMDKKGNGTVWILGDEDNSRLAVSMDEGTLMLQKESGAHVHALGGGLNSADGPALTIRGTGEVKINHSIAMPGSSGSTGAGGGSENDQIADTAGVMLEGGLLEVLAHEAIGALNGDGVVSDSGIGYTLTVGGGDSSGHFSGALKDGLGVTKTGTGTQTFSGDTDGAIFGSGMKGPVIVEAGTLNLTGSFRHCYGVFVKNGATLAGTGTVRRITLESGAFLAAGDAGIPASTGPFDVGYEGNGSVDWQKHSILRCRLDSAATPDGRLHIDGVLTSSDSGIPVPREFDFQGTGVAGQTYVLATFNATDFSVADFTFTGLPAGLSGSFTLENNRLTFITSPFSRVVTIAADENDPTGTAGAGLSLREALRDVPNGETITFAPALNGQTITLDPANGEIRLARRATVDATALPNGITIDGGAGENRIFRIAHGITASMLGLTLTGGGGLDDDNGGALYSDGTVTLRRCTFTGNESADGSGGAIYNGHLATMTLDECTLADNFASDIGGAIVNAGTLTLANTLLTGNRSPWGGAIFQMEYGPLTLRNCTLTANRASHSSAIYIDAGAEATLTHCTLSGNHADALGTIYNSGGRLTLAYSIVAGTTGGTADIHNDGILTRVGANLVQSLLNTGSATVDGSGTISSAPPLLAPPGNYGGSTHTMALLPGSPARNAAAGSMTVHDQRGFPIVGTPDIGAYEAGTFTNYNAWAWESLPATATASERSQAYDFDNDGRLNSDEYNYLTDPVSGASFFAPSVTPGDGNLRISFISAPGRTYTLEQSDSPASGWSNVPGQSVTMGDGTLKHFTIPMDVARRFFRILAGL